jgi:EpsI family protein
MKPIQAWIYGGLMSATALGSHALQPTQYAAQRNHIQLQNMIPSRFSHWSQEPDAAGAVVASPQLEATVAQVYAQSLMRVYRGADGARVMLSIAYSTDQRGNSGHHVHLPEVCYPAQGYMLAERANGSVLVAGRAIPMTRMVARQGTRTEPLMYWVTLDGQPENDALKFKIDQVRASLLHGVVQDGLIFRVSVIDDNPQHAYQTESEFLNALFAALSPHARQAFFGIRS